MVWWGGGGPRKDAREILGGTFRVNAIGETPKERQQTSRLQWTATGVAVIAAIAALLGAILTGVANSKSATAASEAARTAKQAVTNQDLTTLITSLVAASQKTQELERTLQARHDLERLRGVPAADAPIEAALEALRDGAINLGLTVDSLITSVGDAEVRQCVEAIRRRHFPERAEVKRQRARVPRTAVPTRGSPRYGRESRRGSGSRLLDFGKTL